MFSRTQVIVYYHSTSGTSGKYNSGTTSTVFFVMNTLVKLQ